VEQFGFEGKKPESESSLGFNGCIAKRRRGSTGQGKKKRTLLSVN